MLIEQCDLKGYQVAVDTLARSKGWTDDLAWLGLGCFKEMGELWQAIEHKESPDKIGSEFAGVMHYLLQLMKKEAPTVDLDLALKEEIFKNFNTKKKTYENGEIVRK